MVSAFLYFAARKSQSIQKLLFLGDLFSNHFGSTRSDIGHNLYVSKLLPWWMAAGSACFSVWFIEHQPPHTSCFLNHLFSMTLSNIKQGLVIHRMALSVTQGQKAVPLRNLKRDFTLGHLQIRVQWSHSAKKNRISKFKFKISHLDLKIVWVTSWKFKAHLYYAFIYYWSEIQVQLSIS